MNHTLTILLLVAAGIALVVQNLMMVRITATVSTILITLVINSVGGRTVLLLVLLWQIHLSNHYMMDLLRLLILLAAEVPKLLWILLMCIRYCSLQ